MNVNLMRSDLTTLNINKYKSIYIFFITWVSGSGTLYADNTFYINDNE